MSDVQQAEHPVAAVVARAVVASAEQVMRESGGMQIPTVYLFADDLDQPYAGYVRCRPFYRGADAARAIARLGELPASMYATRLLLAWEHCDLLTALNAPGEAFPTALVTVEATFTGHILTWQPFTFTWGPDSEYGAPTVLPSWQRPTSQPDAPLPRPMRAALDRWRALVAADFDPTTAGLQRDGYTVCFFPRT